MAGQGHTILLNFTAERWNGGNAQELARLTDSTFSTLFSEGEKIEKFIRAANISTRFIAY